MRVSENKVGSANTTTNKNTARSETNQPIAPATTAAALGTTAGARRNADARSRRRVPQRVLQQVDREAVDLVARGLDERRVDVEDDLVAVVARSY